MDWNKAPFSKYKQIIIERHTIFMYQYTQMHTITNQVSFSALICLFRKPVCINCPNLFIMSVFSLFMIQKNLSLFSEIINWPIHLFQCIKYNSCCIFFSGRPYSVIKDVVAQLCDVLVEIHMDFPKVLLLPIQGLPLSIWNTRFNLKLIKEISSDKNMRYTFYWRLNHPITLRSNRKTIQSD